MKVISLWEPWASLIYEKKKRIETRSWQTTYRGELYIHASMKKVNLTDPKTDMLISLLENREMKYGKIIAKCRLVDCVYMDEEFIKKIKGNPQEYLCGEYAIGRYGWILEDIEPIEPIFAKGQLNIWEFYSVEEILQKMDAISYGWLDSKKRKYDVLDDTNSGEYRVRSPKEVQASGLGICWDQVELERFYFKPLSLKSATYFLCYYGDVLCPSHTFLVYRDGGKFYWFEHSWENHRGIHSYSTLKELLEEVRAYFIREFVPEGFDSDYLCLRKYTKPPFHISCLEFYHHCEKLDCIDLDHLEQVEDF